MDRPASFFRKAIFALSVATISLVLSIWLYAVLAANGIGILDGILLTSFFVSTASAAVAASNAGIGFFLQRTVALDRSNRPLRAFRDALSADELSPVPARYAVAMTLRHEDLFRALEHLRTTVDSLAAIAPDDSFDVFVLSDSTEPDAIAAEEAAVPRLAETLGATGIRLIYRRRPDPVGYKGQNLHEFCDRWGDEYEFLILLDADSLMTGKTIAALVRVMAADSRIGILQTLSVGLPASGFFARILQFGLRQSLRTVTVGASWWQGHWGQYWGHNAIVRIAPFRAHCRLPVLPGLPPFGGHVICHDQIEAALLAGAGYQVRLLPLETGSFESNPPTLPDFLRRARRWCQGNMQNLLLLGRPGLRMQERVNMFIVSLKFLAAASTTVFVAAAVAMAILGGFVRDSGLEALYVAWILVFLAPRLFGLADAALHRGRSYRGIGRVLCGGFVEVAQGFLVTPIATIATTTCIIGLVLGRTLGWDGQRRVTENVSWGEAARVLWLTNVIGLGLLLLLAAAAPDALPWFLPFLLGPALAIPLAVGLSSGWLSRLTAGHGFCATPEEFNPPREVATLLPVLGFEESAGVRRGGSDDGA